jgi:hypothetical protein
MVFDTAFSVRAMGRSRQIRRLRIVADTLQPAVMERRGRDPHGDRECNRSRARLPALLGLAPESGAGRGRVGSFAPIEGGETAAEFIVELRQLRSAGGIVFFQKAKGLADDLARRLSMFSILWLSVPPGVEGHFPSTENASSTFPCISPNCP